MSTGARQRDGDNDLPSQKRFRSEQQQQQQQQQKQQQQQQQQHHQQQQQQQKQQQQQQTHREHQQDSPLKYWSDPGPQLLENNTVPPSQAGFRNAQQQQQQDSQLTQPLPLSCQPRRTSSTGLASTGASSPMQLTLPTLSFEPSMAASISSATQDLRLANEILRLQLLQQQLLNQIQCQQQQQTNSFANFPSMSFTQALLDDQVPMATCDMPSNATDQIQDLSGFGFMDHVFGNDLAPLISELDCVQHAAEFGGGYSSSTSNMYRQDGGLNNAK
ncbi:basic-leucine zipper transcription factor A-like [Lingula anatina]|uniref:Basic-leucine zipper transcription factor A-like n=1 Tax=Lingula anatina TaxID=7574 RepID=A0A1S3IZU7_LINAN|nr:basic-leucine zipper transcription factor A-like [Lingula anatina]|eukprot:XP_013403526.1 basic-leucine zipper transcription factor A-like [Lingula anatina]